MTNQALYISKPSVGRYTSDVLAMAASEEPKRPDDGYVLVRTLLLSLDPSNLMWLKLQPGWMEEVQIGDVMKGPALAVVEESGVPELRRGDIVSGALPWREWSTLPADALVKVDPNPRIPLTAHLTIFSHVGRAAMIGTRWVGEIKAGDTMLVSTAAGATGSLACQIAVAQGATVIGITGSDEKCRTLVEDFGVAHAINYKSQDVPAMVARHCPEGPQVYFDNVGGAMLDALLPKIAIRGRVVMCGQISQYDHEAPGQAHRFANMFYVFMRRLRLEGFVVPDFQPVMGEVDAALLDLFERGKLQDRPHVLDGLAAAPEGLEMLQSGANNGKLIVQVGHLA